MKKIIVFLSCQRCGSSFAAEFFHHLGMSLGPFDFFQSSLEKPLGLCEAIPVCQINHQLHQAIYGFMEDMLDYRLAAQIMKNREILFPDISQINYEWIRFGTEVMEHLIHSGDTCGFKHPATLLFWFYWDHVLSQFHGLDIHLIFLIRPPAAIASSYARRINKPEIEATLYDLIEFYFLRQMRLIHTWAGKMNVVRFTGEHFAADMTQAVCDTDLAWNGDAFSRLYNHALTKDVIADINHPVQQLYHELTTH